MKQRIRNLLSTSTLTISDWWYCTCVSRVMPCHVIAHGGQVGRTVRTLRTTVRLLPGVNPHVVAQRVFCRGTVRAVRATEGLLSGVGADVFDQVISPNCGMITERTQMYLGGSSSSTIAVHLHLPGMPSLNY